STTKTDSPDPVLVGDDLTYDIVVANNGPDGAAGVTMTDTLPAGVTFRSVDTSSGTCSQSAGTVTCDVDALDVDAQVTVTVVVTPNETGTITNQASVASSTDDPDGSNNTATETTTVNPPPAGGVETGAGGTAPRPAWPMIVVGLLLLAAGVLVRRRRGPAED